MARTPKTTSASAASLYKVLTPINPDGDDFQIGDTLELMDVQADALLACTPPAIAFAGSLAAEAADTTE